MEEHLNEKYKDICERIVQNYFRNIEALNMPYLLKELYDIVSFIDSAIIANQTSIELANLISEGKNVAEILIDKVRMALMLMEDGEVKLSADTKKGTETIVLDIHTRCVLLDELLEDIFKTPKDNDEFYSNVKAENLRMLLQKLETLNNLNKSIIGRGKKFVPLLGIIVQFVMLTHRDLFKTLTQTDSYCILADIIFLTGNILSISSDEWNVLSKKEKSKRVKDWIASSDKNDFEGMLDELGI